MINSNIKKEKGEDYSGSASSVELVLHFYHSKTNIHTLHSTHTHTHILAHTNDKTGVGAEGHHKWPVPPRDTLLHVCVHAKSACLGDEKLVFFPLLQRKSRN